VSISISPNDLKVLNPNFKSGSTATVVTSPNVEQSTLERTPKADVVVTNKPKKKMSKATKALLWTGGIIGTLAASIYVLCKHQTNKLEKLYKENIVFKNLAEHIEYKEATTVDEGIKFAKEVLGIEKVDDTFTLDAINFANKGLVDVSNANKGSLFMPKQLRFMELKGETIAHVISEVKSERFGELAINKKYFDNEFLTDYLDKKFMLRKYASSSSKAGDELSKETKRKTNAFDALKISDNDTTLNEYTPLFKKYRADANNLSINEKRKLFSIDNKIDGAYISSVYYAPLNTVKTFSKNFEDVGLKVNIDELSKLSTTEQTKKLKEMLINYYDKTGEKLIIDLDPYVECKTIYHEMGHLQDFAKNLKDLDIKKWKFLSFKEFQKEVKEGKEHVDTSEIEHVDNRWRGLTYGDMKNLFKTKPEEFKKKYPDLYEFLTNQESQQTAGKISGYAQTSIGEFIAETYAEMIAGKKIPEDVMKLYEKYNGPKLNK
jgi:hypothetical protein